MPTQFQLRGHSLESLRWQLFEKYGAAARIVRAERIQTGGLFGIGATTSFEVVVEVDTDPASHTASGEKRGLRSAAPTRRGAIPRRSLSDLLAEADRADDARPSGSDGVMEIKPDFDVVLRKIAADEAHGPDTDSQGVAPGHGEMAIPRPSTMPGDLIVLVGLRDQPLNTAWSMLSHLQNGAELLTAGDYRSNGLSHVFLDSIEVKKAQAMALGDGKPLLIAFSFGQRGSSNLSMLASLRPKQLWLVVDAAHKPDDTQSWVRRACRYSVPDALAVLGATDTATPESVNALKVPVGWVDGRPATSSEL
ncbi:hypothetical protein [Arthrobacter glacialis]|uniref:Uncharacterized protein n=1 Tax=Arthrobacter glacialis TaxID=1664 RepID=A0A2S3ZY69_ARTGL|nr:hypothetical protein [Arthrobacter glacialis]POH73862.1 hypothetical protein CVS27_08050 [Arthrobacter glacialis]